MHGIVTAQHEGPQGPAPRGLEAHGRGGSKRRYLPERGLLIRVLALLLLGFSAMGRNTTAAFFTSTASSSGAFTTQSLVFTNRVNGGPACSAGGVNGYNAVCDTLGTVSNMTPGESKFGRVSLTNDGTGNIALWLSTAGGGADAADMTGAAEGPAAGRLGLLLFRCTSTAPGNPATDCGGTAPLNGESLVLTPIIGACMDGTGAAVPFTLAPDTRLSGEPGGLIFPPPAGSADLYLRKSTSAGTSGPFDTPDYYRCTGEPAVRSGVPIGGPEAVAIVSPSGSQPSRLPPTGNNTDHLGVLVYMPTLADNSLQGKTATLTFSWTAEQEVSQFAR